MEEHNFPKTIFLTIKIKTADTGFAQDLPAFLLQFVQNTYITVKFYLLASFLMNREEELMV